MTISTDGRVSATQYLAIARFLGAARLLAKPFTHEELADALTESPPAPAAIGGLVAS